MTCLRLIIICVFTLLGTFRPSLATSEILKLSQPQSIEELQTQLEVILKDVQVPGMSIAIVNKSGPEFVAGIGKADLASNRDVTTATLFRIGSISKGFVSLAVLMLASEGKLSLVDPLHTLAPEVWFDNQWESTDPIRLVHLLENTTGWDDMHLREFAKTRSTMSFLEALDYDHNSRTSRWRPGTRMSYCNSGPAVAAYIVKKITGKNFEEYITDTFFKPIGMQTATYLQPASEATTTLYHSDGQTPHIYWDLLYPAIGSINASANDMAKYLMFYLNRGNVSGTQVMPAHLINRLETPTSTWSAKQGLPVGYGLGNYSSIHEGFVYHGHDGNVPGGISVLAYMPNEGVGYFFSLNAENREALTKVDAVIRAYITRQLPKPTIPPIVSLPDTTYAFAGWYEPNSARMELFSFLERLVGIAYIHFDDNKLLIDSLSEKDATYLPVTDTEFLYAPKNESPDPVPTLKLLENAEGQFFQLSLGTRNAAALHVTMKHIPTWLAILEITLFGFVLLAFTSTLISVPFWIISRKQFCKTEHNMLLWPLVAVLSLLSIILVCVLSKDLFIERLGNLTIWSFSIFVATILFAVASLASIITLWCTFKQSRGLIRIYSATVTVALVLSTIYLAYWGIIGLRTWV